jgi:hypothetical protein
MNKNGVVAVVVVVAAVVLVGLWAMRSGDPVPGGPDCSAPPTQPKNLAYTKDGEAVTLTWAPPAGGDTVSSYVIEAGGSPGANNQGTFVAIGTATSFQRAAPKGTYYVRMFARNACGTSPASEEITVTTP